MKILYYNELDYKKIPGIKKMQRFLEADDFYSAEVKKVGQNLYRARLDDRNRLLFSLYEHNKTVYVLVLEHIANHAYEKSRFLRGSQIDKNKIQRIESVKQAPKEKIRYINPDKRIVHLLDKILSFDDAQDQIYHLPLPVIIIGSAGSGKTALTLEKMKQSVGDVLYVTHSAFLTHHSRTIYYSNDYENENQQIDFLSFQEFLESIHVPMGKEVDFRIFNDWFLRHRHGKRVKDPHKLFEEFKGIITGSIINRPWMEREEYLKLGIRQSIFLDDERIEAYDLFEKYLSFLKNNALYDANIISHEYLKLCQPRYDYIIVDEVQDLTNIQLKFILKSLRSADNFILCGDSNQIVHPNFFSWSKIKTLFYSREPKNRTTKLIRILTTNFRNSRQITNLANRILKLKNARFGSIDKESNYLVKSSSPIEGEIHLLNNSESIKKDLNEKTRLSTQFAVIVMHEEQKAEARKFFSTPLIFSIQEAKGLEYENIILYNFISSAEKKFFEICRDINLEHLEHELLYSRAKDKSDKTHEVYKFFINSFYVAITRSIRNLYMIESTFKLPIFDLLKMKAGTGIELESQNSSIEDWQHEAHKLELQG